MFIHKYIFLFVLAVPARHTSLNIFVRWLYAEVSLYASWRLSLKMRPSLFICPAQRIIQILQIIEKSHLCYGLFFRETHHNDMWSWKKVLIILKRQKAKERSAIMIIEFAECTRGFHRFSWKRVSFTTSLFSKYNTPILSSAAFTKFARYQFKVSYVQWVSILRWGIWKYRK